MHPTHKELCWDRSSADPMVVGEALFSVLPLTWEKYPEKGLHGLDLCMRLVTNENVDDVGQAHLLLEDIVKDKHVHSLIAKENSTKKKGWARFKEKAKKTWKKFKKRFKKKKKDDDDEDDDNYYHQVFVEAKRKQRNEDDEEEDEALKRRREEDNTLDIESVPPDLRRYIALMQTNTVADIDSLAKTNSAFKRIIKTPKFWETFIRLRLRWVIPYYLPPLETYLKTLQADGYTDFKWIAIALEVLQRTDKGLVSRFRLDNQLVQIKQIKPDLRDVFPHQYVIEYNQDAIKNLVTEIFDLDKYRIEKISIGRPKFLISAKPPLDRSTKEMLVRKVNIQLGMIRFIYEILRMGYSYDADNNQRRLVSSSAAAGGCPLPTGPLPGLISKRELQLGGELGKGAFGVVRKGVFRGRQVAVKTIQGQPTPEAMAEFADEARLLANVPPHPNVVQFIGITQDPLMLVTELVTGGALDSRLFKKKNQPVTWNNVMRWARDIARGVRHLHSNGILHRDLATRNVLLDEKGNAKVTDFGLSVRVCTPQSFSGAPALAFRQQEFFRGPYKWMAPESLRAQDFSVKSDVWSYGVTLWEILARREPFEYIPDINVVKQYVLERGMRLPLPQRWPQRIKDLLVSCWQEDATRRPDMMQISSILKGIGDNTYDTQNRVLPVLNDQEASALYGLRLRMAEPFYEEYYDDLVDVDMDQLHPIPLEALIWSHYEETGEMYLIGGVISNAKRLLTQKGRNKILAKLDTLSSEKKRKKIKGILRDAKVARKAFSIVPGKKGKTARAQLDEIIKKAKEMLL